MSYGTTLAAWRILGREEDLTVGLHALLPVLAERIPLRQLVLRRLDAGELRVETLGAAPPLAENDPMAGAAPIARADVERAVARLRGVDAAREPASPDGALAPLAPGARGELLVGALRTGGRIEGVLVAIARDGASFEARHVAAIASVLEPASAALDNQRRRRELVALREVAEADKRAVLAKLGREEISDAVVGAERGLRDVMTRVGQVAGADVPILLLGETGSGKEVVARAVHASSHRASGPFLRVNCGAIPGELVDSELFGHERGSFTGASAQRRGWFERADSGTLFLDEIAELPLAVQVRLLRVLQDGTFERVGGQATLHADVRIVAATHRDLGQMVAAGTFRQDLLYRVAGFEIRIPPLRERVADIAELASHFVRRAQHRFGLPPLTITPDGLALLQSYGWPGNVRELAAVVDRAALLHRGGRLDVRASLGVAAPGAAAAVTGPPIPAPSTPAGAARAADERASVSLDDAIRRHVIAALERCLGRVDGPFGAARALGIHPNTLRARMRKLGIEPRAVRARTRDTT